MVRLQACLLGQGLLPLPLKGASHQPVLGLGGVELPVHPFGLVASPLKTTLPLAFERLALAFHLANREQACFQRRRLECLKHEPNHQCIKWRRLQRLTDRLAVIAGHADTRIAGIGAIVVVLRHHAQAAPAADQQPGEQRLAGTREARRCRLVRPQLRSGGATLVQLPKDAAYPSMPRAATVLTAVPPCTSPTLIVVPRS